MAITETHAGRQYPPTPPYAISAAKIAEFAGALGDASPHYRGERPVAPPTFAATIASSAWQLMFDDPELELALRRIVHGDQRFDYARALLAGDVVSATLTIDRVRVRGSSEIISSSVAISDLSGETVCTVTATFVHNRGDAA